jgi:hypothetical protein
MLAVKNLFFSLLEAAGEEGPDVNPGSGLSNTGEFRSNGRGLTKSRQNSYHFVSDGLRGGENVKKCPVCGEKVEEYPCVSTGGKCSNCKKSLEIKDK